MEPSLIPSLLLARALAAGDIFINLSECRDDPNFGVLLKLIFRLFFEKREIQSQLHKLKLTGLFQHVPLPVFFFRDIFEQSYRKLTELFYPELVVLESKN